MTDMAGRLSLVATPIGNLGDMSPRAVETLKNADLIAAEDTRNSIKLLNHFDIRTPLTSYHKYNRTDKAYELVGKLEEGLDVALITDAGMPAVSDPGEDLVRIAMDAGIDVTVIPGPCAAVSALAISGLPTARFTFEGFLPTENKDRDELLNELRGETRTMIIYEAPHRLAKTLGYLRDTFGDERRISLVREITKVHEEVLRTTLAGACRIYGGEEPERVPKGEYVLVIEGKSRQQVIEEEREAWADLSVPEHVAMYESRGMSRKDAMKQAAADRHVSRRDIYRQCLDETE